MNISPSMAAAAGQVIVSVLLAFSLHPSAVEVGAIQACTAAGLGLAVAFMTRPFHYSAITGFALAGLSLLAAYKVPHVTPGLVASLNALFGLIAFKVTYGNVTYVGFPNLRGQRPPQERAA